MDMAEDGTSKKVSSLLEEKDAANEDLLAMWKEAEEANSTLSGSAETVLDALRLHNMHSIFMNNMGTLVSIEPWEYMSQNKITLASKVKATIKKFGKILPKAKPRKKRTTLYPIVASTLKFHKDDDVDPADAGSACRS